MKIPLWVKIEDAISKNMSRLSLGDKTDAYMDEEIIKIVEQHTKLRLVKTTKLSFDVIVEKGKPC